MNGTEGRTLNSSSIRWNEMHRGSIVGGATVQFTCGGMQGCNVNLLLMLVEFLVGNKTNKSRNSLSPKGGDKPRHLQIIHAFKTRRARKRRRETSIRPRLEATNSSFAQSLSVSKEFSEGLGIGTSLKRVLRVFWGVIRSVRVGENIHARCRGVREARPGNNARENPEEGCLSRSERVLEKPQARRRISRPGSKQKLTRKDSRS